MAQHHRFSWKIWTSGFSYALWRGHTKYAMAECFTGRNGEKLWRWSTEPSAPLTFHNSDNVGQSLASAKSACLDYVKRHLKD